MSGLIAQNSGSASGYNASTSGAGDSEFAAQFNLMPAGLRRALATRSRTPFSVQFQDGQLCGCMFGPNA